MITRRLTLTKVASLCAVAGLFMLSGASASASVVHPYVCQITGSAVPSATECNGTGNIVPGGFGLPLGVAVDSTGQVYIGDRASKAVDVFDAAGNFTRQIIGTSPGALFNAPVAVAIDGSNDVWVADPGNGLGLVDKFDSSGSFLAQSNGEGLWSPLDKESIAYSNASKHLYVADSNTEVLWVLNSDGTLNSDITGPWASGRQEIRVAADNSGGAGGGDIYVTSGQAGVFRIDGTGEPAAFSGSAPYISGAQITGTPAGSFGRLTGVAVDAAGNVFVLDNSKKVIDEFDSAGVFMGQTSGIDTPNGSFNELQGIAVNAAGNVYVIDDGSPSVVDVLGPGIVIPDVSTETASGLTSTGATLNGTVGPAGVQVTSCEFEYGTSAAFGHTVPCTQTPAQIGSGNAPVPVSAEVALLANTTYYFRLRAANANGTNYGGQEHLLTPGAPSVQAESEVRPTEKAGQTTATLQAQIDPDGRATTYRFEYGETTAYGTSVPVPDGTVGSGEESVSVPAAVLSNLKIGTTYHYRVVASNEYGTTVGPDQEFKTIAAALIEQESAAEVAATSATLKAQINPLGSDTHYAFQYGTTTSYSSSVPAPPGADIGAGEIYLPASVHLQGLAAGTTYHYRVVTVNEPGGQPITVEGPDETFTTQAAGAEVTLPDGRQWEMVTPPNKQGAGIYATGNEQGLDIQASVSGDGITYGATAPFVTNPAGSRSPETTQVISNRSEPDSWETADITTATPSIGPTGVQAGHGGEYRFFSSDLSLGVVESGAEPPYFREADGQFKALVTPTNTPPGTNLSTGEVVIFESASPDLSHVVVRSQVALVKGVPSPALYEWAAGQLQPASVLVNGEATSGALGNQGSVVRHAISNDGSRIVFESFGSAKHFYMRDMVKKETVTIDAPQKGLPKPTEDNFENYSTANSAGSRVFFTSSRRLTASSTLRESYPYPEDLYAFEVTSGGGEPLAGKVTDLTVDGNAGESAGVQGVIGASEDGSYVYFVAGGVLGDAAQHGAEGGHYLYVEHYDEGTKAWAAPKFIAALSGGDSPTWGGGNPQSLKGMTSRVSPDGRYLAFMSASSLTGYENRDANSDVPDEEVFLYDADTGRVVCASCNPSGGQPVGLLEGNGFEEQLVDSGGLWKGRWLAGNVPAWTGKDLSSALYQSRYLSDSGRLFFDSADALVPADVNGKEDVYEYEPAGVGSCQGPGYGQSASVVFSASVGGCVALISAGTSSEESAFMDASETGGDVFFLTLSRLSPRDYDTSIDIYDAHECTASAPCAPPPSLTPPPCTTGDACKPGPTPQPTLFGEPSSETFSGAGNIVPSASEPKVTSRSAHNAQKLAKALKACRKKPKGKRAGCERQARKRYGAKQSRAGKSSSTRTRR
jgi:hypothetical protein